MGISSAFFGGGVLDKPLTGSSRLAVAICLLLLFSLAFFNTAWVAEDAYITFRVVDNALNGYGLTWNPGERVQVYTHPLWFAMLFGSAAVFDNPYYVSLLLSFVLLCLTLVLMLRLSVNFSLLHVIVISFLLFSRSFVDYSSSGLENPLTHFLIVSIFAISLRGWGGQKSYAVFFIASMLFLCRPDTLILVFPLLLLTVFEDRSLKYALIGGAPAILWVVFSLFYYGAPVPNTALAKVGGSVPWSEGVSSAWGGLKWLFLNDPFSLFLLLTGAALGLFHEKLRPFSLGLALWFPYYFYVGGDYMAGRFFSSSVVLATCILIVVAAPSFLLFCLPLLLAVSSVLTKTLFSPVTFMSQHINSSGIADERAFYYRGTGLKPALINRGPAHPWLIEGRLLRGQEGVFVRCAIGMVGFSAGPSVYWLDPLALADPLLARLPARSNTRVGHYERAFPKGYVDTIVKQENLIVDSEVKALYEDVRLAVASPLFTPERLGAIWRLNTGGYKHLSESFDRDNVELSGVPFIKNDMTTCLGVPHGHAVTWKLTGEPIIGVPIVY
ncbi:hypothetical protein [Microbulbifer sp. YPW1]|uniref:hypothetical protein n=1 Tax=Microbulbifer sp. YPW1 TaxID=2745199 RepID=UPI00159AB252|nr:hypothetical protein [Microbulbifer sp. YPW1]QKX15657.1 hypothetical protein HUW35_00810 [Microbulbifer sp. YPW1]